MAHDPDRQAGYLRQTLSQGRRPVAFLLGAGCPASIKNGDEPLIPAVERLTEMIRTELNESENSGPWATLTGQLAADADIETILSHIRSLRAVAGDDEVRGLTGEALQELETAVCSAIAQAASCTLPSRNTPFHKVASWIGSTERLYAAEIFTPNYDLLIEQALEETHTPFFDGFVGTVRPFFDLHAIEADELPARWARLWKIHGSINWTLGSDRTVYRAAGTSPVDARMIYPSHLKYEQSRRMPYLAFLDRLRTFLRTPSAALITCGFSFRDEHLNEVILEGAEGNASATVFGLLHGELSHYANAVAIATTRSNLTILAADAAVIGTRCDAWATADEPPATSDEIAVRWSSTPAAESKMASSFMLGNFVQLGALLTDVMGKSLGPLPADAG
jgi:hypothetical protein